MNHDTAPSTAPQDFESIVARLEEIAQRLEKSDIKLEEALLLFEEGVKLTREGGKRLDLAEAQLEMLQEGQVKPLEMDL
jgi:exodeoxyribonuclease VII small subunit